MLGDINDSDPSNDSDVDQQYRRSNQLSRKCNHRYKEAEFHPNLIAGQYAFAVVRIHAFEHLSNRIAVQIGCQMRQIFL